MKSLISFFKWTLLGGATLLSGAALITGLNGLMNGKTEDFLLASGLFLVNVFTENFFLIIAIFIGAGQGFIFPTSVAILADEVKKNYRGTAMGVYGSLRNIGKVIGPVCAGFALANYNFSLVFMALASIIVVIAFLVMLFWNKIVRKNIFNHFH